MSAAPPPHPFHLKEPMSKLNIAYRPLAELIPYVRNARTHSDEQVIQIAASIREFGWTNPVLIDADRGIIAGHGRVMAARKLGLAEVPTIELSHLTPAQRRAYVLADNKLAENAGWDFDLLKLELGELDDEGFDLSLLGFNADELTKLLAADATDGLTDPDEVPEVPVNPVTIEGDVWLLGRHRLICGDATQASVVERVLDGVSPALMVTDPPYGVNYDPTRRARGIKDGAKRSLGVVVNDDRADWTEAWSLFPGDVAYVWHGMKTAGTVHDSLQKAGFELRSQIVWRKASPAISVANINAKTAGYNPQHECCFYVVKSGGRTGWAGGKSQSTVWDIPHVKNETGHSAQKPVECMKRPIENNSSPGQAVYEPFSGSGTTIIAGETTGRTVMAVEINPAFVDVAVKRWQEFTGKQATLEADGRSFDEVAASRPSPTHEGKP